LLEIDPDADESPSGEIGTEAAGLDYPSVAARPHSIPVGNAMPIERPGQLGLEIRNDMASSSVGRASTAREGPTAGLQWEDLCRWHLLPPLRSDMYKQFE